ncbi:MAG: SET domain-containing protein-lysine N-methyltransferase [Candidatus Moraniibacteriota bacterium]|nr:MAG: SET domain-containing protein-lysine N-methyltransferase [Candidatus Moranbacteria bacterium]
MPTQQDQSKRVRVKRTGIGLGLFAAANFKRHETIIEYIGERIPTSVGDERDNRYIFNVSSRFDIDGSARHNTARYTNHSCRPNCDAINRRGRIFIVARKQIALGEEITFHYGKDHFEGYIKPAGCKCKKCIA